MIRSITLEIVTTENITEREYKILHTLILNLSASVVSVVTKKGVALNPIMNSEATFSLELVFQESISENDATEIQTSVERRIINAFMMSELEPPSFKIGTVVAHV